MIATETKWLLQINHVRSISNILRVGNPPLPRLPSNPTNWELFLTLCLLANFGILIDTSRKFFLFSFILPVDSYCLNFCYSTCISRIVILLRICAEVTFSCMFLEAWPGTANISLLSHFICLTPYDFSC